jgi:(p)ppGpp synthase/HD superfamily hydrolase
MYSYRIEQAIRAAAVLHRDQERKGSMPFPYITHLMSVACILHDYTDDEDIIIAGLLHDTVEDTDYTLPELEEDFGGRVREIVETVTEEKYDGDRKRTWADQKKHYAVKLKKGPKEAVMVAAADKAHNFRTMIEEYYDEPTRFFQDFGKNLDERLEVYQTIANVINNRLEGPLLNEFNHVFESFKEFIYAVKKASEKEF